MFNGLIREIAQVKSLNGNILKLKTLYTPKIGDSIAVNGVCLTVIHKDTESFSLEISKHTQENIALENYKNHVHIEPALQLQTKIDGHLVQGHVNGIGLITKIIKNTNQVEIYINASKKILISCIPNGSICIDGVSLTLAEIYQDSFKIIVIPHTFSHTLFHTYKIGRRVNIETDMLVRSIQALLTKKDNLDWKDFDFLTMSY